jgi:hypothetical protein
VVAVQTIVAAYLIATLSATAVAKLATWRDSGVGVMRERVIPAGLATWVAVLVGVVELMLATALAFRVTPAWIGAATAVLFVAFGVYRLLVVIKTNSLMCSCTGTTRRDPASRPAVGGALLAYGIQIVCAVVLAVWNGRPAGLGAATVAGAALIAPLLLLVAARLAGRNPLTPQDRSVQLSLAPRPYNFEEIVGTSR